MTEKSFIISLTRRYSYVFANNDNNIFLQAEFNFAAFLAKHHLGDPVAGNFYLVIPFCSENILVLRHVVSSFYINIILSSDIIIQIF